MQYRPLDANGDYQVGVNFLANSPATVAQAVLTRLKLWQGEWFLDVTEGTPWIQSILGRQATSPDVYIKQRILGTLGVTSISNYSGTYTASTRTYVISATINTLYGTTTVSTTL